MRRVFFVAAVVVALAAVAGLAGCSRGSSEPTRVSITESGFNPAEASIKVGQTVTWTNDGTIQHTATWDDVDSGGIEPGKTYPRTFDQAGTYRYYCRYHPSKIGTVTVR